MADFTSSFWSWAIGIVTVASIVWCFVFALMFSSRKKREPGEKAESMGHVWDEDLEELNNPLPRWWFYMFLISCIWAMGYLIMYPGLGAYAGMLGWSQQKQYEQEISAAEENYGPIFNQYLNQDLNQVAANDDAITIGKRLYSTYCTTCHGSDAGGARGYPNLKDKDWLYGGSPEQIKTTILTGRQGAMPPWGAILGEEGVFNVTSYVEQLAGREVDSIHASKGKEIFNQNCVICHSPDGTGNQQFGAPNLTDDIWLYGGSQKKIMESIAMGRNGRMPPHKEFLGEAKIHLLAAYVYSLSNQN